MDIVVSSDLPNNHLRFLEGYFDQFEVLGTCYEKLQIFLAAPSYMDIGSLTDLVNAPSVNKTILGFDTLECPVCPDLTQSWISARLPGFRSQPTSKSSLTAIIADKLQRKERFVTTMYAPMFYGALFPQLKALDMEEFTPKIFNQGKALIRKESIGKLDPTTLRRFGAVFIGSDELSKMDYQIYQKQQAGIGANAPEEVALQWIRDHNATYSMFSW